MSESKFKIFCGVLLILFIIFSFSLLSYQFYRLYQNRVVKPETEKPINNISLLTFRGDTLLNLETDANEVQIWVEQTGELDVWVNLENGGWIRK